MKNTTVILLSIVSLFAVGIIAISFWFIGYYQGYGENLDQQTRQAYYDGYKKCHDHAMQQIDLTIEEIRKRR